MYTLMVIMQFVLAVLCVYIMVVQRKLLKNDKELLKYDQEFAKRRRQ